MKKLPENFWDTVESYLRKYHSRNDVLKNDIMKRFVDDELEDRVDIARLLEEFGDVSRVEKALKESNMNLYIEALENKFQICQGEITLDELSFLHEESINFCKRILEKSGYFVDNLWHIDDVTNKYQDPNNDAMKVLSSSIYNDYIIESINVLIDENAEALGLKKVIKDCSDKGELW